ncbi:hypothetical protein [Shewanella litorisediminis]|uniref:DUF1579 domain-containing protein n=2 Tax=Shewanella litorisediminis TaxID=1173586 RepID=A0ABX7G6C4_9GAMM|nr:hypothetical protein [Shewanella litorisediminis]MCL2917717.1 hypothetical protein [Shewanella litorisediminis]QRH02836.1 hypothetical protein JQC75_05330 [Shewanella litorisediminis]
MMKHITGPAYSTVVMGTALGLLLTIGSLASAMSDTSMPEPTVVPETAISTQVQTSVAPQEAVLPQEDVQPTDPQSLQGLSDTAKSAETTGDDIKASDAQSGDVQSDDAQALIGSWELVSGRYLDGEGRWVSYNTLGLVAIKVISASHFSFTTMKTVKNKQEFWAAGAGEYRLNGQSYTEYPSLNSFQVPHGQGFSFDYELKGNQWHTKRFEEGVLKEEEVWQRLD